MELSSATRELLRDEACVCLCRESLQENLRELERQKAELVSSRSPFAILAGRKTRAALDSTLRTTHDHEAALRRRLLRATRYQTWLRRCLGRELPTHLEATSPDYQRVSRILGLLATWEKGATRLLPDMLVAYVREMHALRGRAEKIAGPSGTPELSLLREIAGRVEQQAAAVAELSGSLRTHADEMGLPELRLPELPQFPSRTWADGLPALPSAQVMLELRRAETQLNAFLNTAPALAAPLESARCACAQRQDSYVQQYWDQLRAHAHAQGVAEREVDKLLDTLAERYDPDIGRYHREFTQNPFGVDSVRRG